MLLGVWSGEKLDQMTNRSPKDCRIPRYENCFQARPFLLYACRQLPNTPDDYQQVSRLTSVNCLNCEAFNFLYHCKT